MPMADEYGFQPIAKAVFRLWHAGWSCAACHASVGDPADELASMEEHLQSPFG
jgi:hypothetical protein